ARRRHRQRRHRPHARPRDRLDAAAHHGSHRLPHRRPRRLRGHRRPLRPEPCVRRRVDEDRPAAAPGASSDPARSDAASARRAGTRARVRRGEGGGLRRPGAVRARAPRAPARRPRSRPAPAGRRARPVVTTPILAVFALVYLAMLLGGIPGLALDRTGAALLGAIALIATELVSPQQAWQSIDASTLFLLFGLMVVSAQLRLGGFYDHVTRRVAEADLAPDALLALLVAVAGVLSAVLANDIVCLAMAPILIEGC